MSRELPFMHQFRSINWPNNYIARQKTQNYRELSSTYAKTVDHLMQPSKLVCLLGKYVCVSLWLSCLSLLNLLYTQLAFSVEHVCQMSLELTAAGFNQLHMLHMAVHLSKGQESNPSCKRQNALSKFWDTIVKRCVTIIKNVFYFPVLKVKLILDLCVGFHTCRSHVD